MQCVCVCLLLALVSLSSSSSGLVPGVRLSDVVWGFSELLADEILRSSSFFQELRSGNLTQRCYDNFQQQEALYLTRVSSTLEALISRSQEAVEPRSLLQETLKHYSSRNQSLPESPSPQWLLLSLQSLHSLVLEEPIYWLLALSSRPRLRVFMAGELQGARVKDNRLLQQWREDTKEEVTWILRVRKLMEEQQDHMDAFKAINIFREQMMNQKSFYKALSCDEEKKR
ncbi:hypothetical protein PBY51_005787 [Eleginops maclovinus]|uniref:Uncharacterized protein n=1 Tax=Eleginops maclovinus TaxID=56733 RepID=A0AAN7WQ03_ELEMC|nr:hypothetical protein PBY51_005787 [Eleginops maclovinus]